MIPKIIYMCDKTLHHIHKYSVNWKKLNPQYEIRLSNDSMCEHFLLKQYSETHRNLFRYIPDGPIKADFWRVCILYKYGGVYIDADNEPLKPFSLFIEPAVDFVTCSTYWNTYIQYNPNLIMAKAGDTILKKCIDMYIDLYTNKTPYAYWEWSIMKILTMCLIIPNYHKLDGIYYLDGKKIQIIKECPGLSHKDAHNTYKGVRVFNNRYANWDHVHHCFPPLGIVNDSQQNNIRFL